MIGWKDIFALIEALAWPLVVLVALIVFRESLSNFLKVAAHRITKISLSIITLEMPLPEASRSESDFFVSILPMFASGGDVLISGVDDLLLQIEGDKVDYLVVDLGRGHNWLTSRLFIFAIMLQRMRDLRCIVFLETHSDDSGQRRIKKHSDIPQYFLGLASPDEIALALARRYPWLETAYIDARKAIEQPEPRLRQGILEITKAAQVISSFLIPIRNYAAKDDPSIDKNVWEYIESRRDGVSQTYWERTKWIDEKRLMDILGNALQNSDRSRFTDSADTPPVKRVQAVLRGSGSFFALVNKNGKFERLIDRAALIERVAQRVGAISNVEGA